METTYYLVYEQWVEGTEEIYVVTGDCPNCSATFYTNLPHHGMFREMKCRSCSTRFMAKPNEVDYCEECDEPTDFCLCEYAQEDPGDSCVCNGCTCKE